MTETVVASSLFGQSGAHFSRCRRYRYLLWRDWDPSRHKLAFCMLNPSTADEVANDPTVARCEVRARRLGFGGLIVINAYAWRSTDPDVLPTVEDPVGPDNDAVIANVAANANMLICGWGKHATHLNRGRRVLEIIRAAGARPMALKLNKDGSPQHPLYIGYDAQPVEMPG